MTVDDVPGTVTIWASGPRGLYADDHGVTVRESARRSRQFAWAEISRFEDGGGYDNQSRKYVYVLVIVLHAAPGRAVAGWGTPTTETLTALRRVAERYGTPADVAGVPVKPGRAAGRRLYHDAGGQPGLWFWDGEQWALHGDEIPGDPDVIFADPWRYLAADVADSLSEPRLADEYTAVWRDFWQVPGTHLRWVSSGPVRRALRTAEQGAIASRRGLVPMTYSVGGRRFARFNPIAGAVRDAAGRPVLFSSRGHFDHIARGRVTFPDQRWLRFPVDGRSPDATMTAVDQDGNKIALYRMVPGGFWVTLVDITVHPDVALTDELLLVLMISAPWLPRYFHRQGEGGG